MQLTLSLPILYDTFTTRTPIVPSLLMTFLKGVSSMKTQHPTKLQHSTTLLQENHVVVVIIKPRASSMSVPSCFSIRFCIFSLLSDVFEWRAGVVQNCCITAGSILGDTKPESSENWKGSCLARIDVQVCCLRLLHVGWTVDFNMADRGNLFWALTFNDDILMPH